MKVRDMRKLDTVKLLELLPAWRQQARELRFKINNKQAKNIRELRLIKKQLAKILTVLRERHQQTAAPSPKALQK